MNAKTLSTCRAFIAMFAVAAMACVPLRASDDELPSAESLMDKHVEATGGKEAHLAVSARQMNGTLAIDVGGHKMEGQITVSIATGKYHLMIEGEFLSLVRATNGSDVWEWRADTDETQRLEGPEKSRTLELARLDDDVNWREQFTSCETAGVSEVNGRSAYEVRVTTAEDETYSKFFDQENGRLVKVERTLKSTQMGDVDSEVFFEDYEQVDGIWLPTRITHALDIPGIGEGTQTYTYQKIEHLPELPASLFAVPAELKSDDE